MNSRYECLDVNNKLIWNLRDIGHTMRRIRDGKGSQKRVLILLRECGSVTQQALTQRLGIQPGSASEVLGKLERAGLLTRTPSRADRRTADIRLTERGEQEAERAFVQRESRHRQMFDCLSPEEKDALLALLERVNDAWDEHYRNDKDQGPAGGGKRRA